MNAVVESPEFTGCRPRLRQTIRRR
jgi:hypothetical protein